MGYIIGSFEVERVFHDKKKRTEYQARCSENNYYSDVTEILAFLFDSIINLNMFSAQATEKLAMRLTQPIKSYKKMMEEISSRAEDGLIQCGDVQALLDIRFNHLVSYFAETHNRYLESKISSYADMADIALCEQKLFEFCNNLNLPNPDILFGKDGNDLVIEHSEDNYDVFFNALDGKTAKTKEESAILFTKMLEEIESRAINIVRGLDVEFYFNTDTRIDRYFYYSKTLDERIHQHTLAILDDKKKHGDCDLVFTTAGIIPVKGGVAKKLVPYSEVALVVKAKHYLDIGVVYSNDAISIDTLNILCKQLAKYEVKSDFLTESKPIWVKK